MKRSIVNNVIDDLGPVKLKEGGKANIESTLDKAAKMGEKGDRYVGHLAHNEVVLPLSFQKEHPAVMEHIRQLFKSMGKDFNKFVVGNPHNAVNKHTGVIMFGDGEGGAGDRGDGGSGSANDGGGTGDRGGGDNSGGGSGSGTGNGGSGEGQGGGQGGGTAEGGQGGGNTEGSPGADASGGFGGGVGGISDVGVGGLSAAEASDIGNLGETAATSSAAASAAAQSAANAAAAQAMNDAELSDIGNLGSQAAMSPAAQSMAQQSAINAVYDAVSQAVADKQAAQQAATANQVAGLTAGFGPSMAPSLSSSLNPNFGSVPNPSSNVGLALGNTTLGSFGLQGVSPPDLNPDVTSPFGGVATNPASVPGYEGPATGLSNTATGTMGAIGSMFGGSTPTAQEVSVASSPSSTGVGKSTSTSTPETTPTASSSTTKGKGYDITGISVIDNAISRAMNNPAATLAGLAIGAVNPVAGAVNTIAGNPVGNAVANALGLGNTVSSTNEPSTSQPTDTSVGDGPSGSVSGGGSNVSSTPTISVPSNTSTTTSTESTPSAKAVGMQYNPYTGDYSKYGMVSEPSLFTPVKFAEGGIVNPVAGVVDDLSKMAPVKGFNDLQMAYSDGAGPTGLVNAPPGVYSNALGTEYTSGLRTPGLASASPSLSPDTPQTARPNVNGLPYANPVAQNPNVTPSMGLKKGGKVNPLSALRRK